MPVPPPTEPSSTGPPCAASSAPPASPLRPRAPLALGSPALCVPPPPQVSPTTGNDQGYPEESAPPWRSFHPTTASRTTPTLWVFVHRIGPSRKPDSRIQAVPVSSPLPFQDT